MLTIRSSDSLYGRIILRYFGFGLVCIGLLLGGVIAAHATGSGSPVWLKLLVATAPLGVLWFGGMQLRTLLTAPEQILTQLESLSENSFVAQDELLPVAELHPSATGWNQLLEHIRSVGFSANLEERLAATLQSESTGDSGDVLNSLSDGVVVTDAAGQIKRTNNSAVALLQLTCEETDAGSTDVNLLLHLRQRFQNGSQRDNLPDVVGRLRTELSCGPELNDGLLRITCAPMLNQAVQSNSFVWIVRDVTQQKLAEQMRTEFVETATHELRTPLANIRAYAETLQLTDDIPLEEQKEFINVINAESTRLSRFVDELLNLSRMDAGSITISRHDTDFERLLHDCIEHTRPQMDGRSQVFETQIPSKLPTLLLDKDKIASCLVNLLGNAAKYTPEGGEIRLVVKQSESEVSVCVEDTGFGISEQDLGRVFSRFFRSADDRVREQCGSGLGLAYTQEITRLHGGRLTVESELNQGSQFTMTLPVAGR